MPLRNVATSFTIEQQRLEINYLAGDVNNIETGVTAVANATTAVNATNATTAATANALAASATGADLTLSGTLTVNGSQTILNTATLEVEDKNIIIAKGSTTDAAASGGGITLKGADDKTLLYDQTGDEWQFNKPLRVEGSQEYTSSASTLETSVTKAAFRVKGATNSSDSLWMGVETTDANPYIQGSNGIGNNAKKLLLNPFGGNVGVNLSNPDVEFHVLGGGTVARFEGTGGNGFISLMDSDDSTQCFAGCDGGSFLIQTSGSSWTNKLVVDTAGRVLIGTSSSSSNAKLAVNGGINNNEAFFELNRLNDPANNQNIGIIDFSQGDASSRNAARLITRRDGGVWGASSLPTRFEFHTCISGSNTAAERLRISSNGNVLPGADNAQDLGSTTLRWANVYTGDLHLSNEGRGNDVDGTSGAWTMQEGSNDLFLINRNTGKKYKFNLTEVS